MSVPGNVCEGCDWRVTRLWWIALLVVVAAGSFAAEASPFAYVTNDQSGSLSVIDTASNTLVATVPVGSQPFGVAITPDETFA